MLHGPYYRWSGYIDGKHRSLTISKEEAEEAQRRIDNYKKILEEIEKIKKDSLLNAPWIQMRKKKPPS